MNQSDCEREKVGFDAMFALFPAISLAISLYSLIADPVMIESQRGETCVCYNRNVIRASIAGQGASGRDWERAWCAPSPEANHRPKTVPVSPRANRGNPPTYPVSGSLGQAQLQLGSLRLDRPHNPSPRSRR